MKIGCPTAHIIGVIMQEASDQQNLCGNKSNMDFCILLCVLLYMELN
jgi:hypothetical protein